MIDANELTIARCNLTVAVLGIAADKLCTEGFGFEATDVAPETFEAVVAEFNECRETGRKFRVWSGGCSDIVYTTAAGNHAFRFWHDLGHAQHGLTFSPDDEIELASRQMAELVRKGVPVDSLALRLFTADTIGQTTYAQRFGGFVNNQLRFVTNVLVRGIDEACGLEANFVAKGL